MFPGPNATVYYNEAGEPLGWSDETYFEPELPEDEWWAHETYEENDYDPEDGDE